MGGFLVSRFGRAVGAQVAIEVGELGIRSVEGISASFVNGN